MPDAARPPLRALLVDADDALERRLADALAETADGARIRLTRAGSVAEAVDRVASEGADLLILRLLRAAPGVFRLVELRAGAPELPVVAIAAAEDEPLALKALQLGAADYLIAERLYGTLAARCLLHAVEVEKVRVQIARQQAEWPSSLTSEGDPHAHAATLRTALPQQFAAMAGEYGRLLDQAVELILHRTGQPLDGQVRELAQRAGDLRAGPRDLIEIHAAAMSEREQREGPQRIRLYVAEGRMRLLELMGHLVTYYRRLSPPGWGRTDG